MFCRIGYYELCGLNFDMEESRTLAGDQQTERGPISYLMNTGAHESLPHEASMLPQTRPKPATPGGWDVKGSIVNVYPPNLLR